jgi:hypothetical protein
MSQPPAPLTLSIWAGQTFQDVLTLQDPTGNPINLTGYTAAMMARPYPEAFDPPYISWTDTAGNIVLGGTAGTITFAIPATVTAALATTAGVPNPFDLQTWFYNMILTSSTGIAEVVIQGALLVFPSITGTRTPPT